MTSVMAAEKHVESWSSSHLPLPSSVARRCDLAWAPRDRSDMTVEEREKSLLRSRVCLALGSSSSTPYSSRPL